jgi:phage tail sheath protein FI
MSSTPNFHGITTTLVSLGARAVTVPSSSVIGIVDTYTPGAGLAASDTPTLITSGSDAAAAFGAASPIAQSIAAILQQSSPVIVAVGVAANPDAGALSAEVVGVDSTTRTGLQALLNAKSLLDVQPKLLISPGHSSTLAVGTAMDAVAGKLRAVAIVDGPNTSDTDALAYAQNFGSKRVYMVDPGAQYLDANGVAQSGPASAFVAGLFAQTDALIGFWASPSNKIITGITGTGRPIEYLDSDPSCRAQLLNNAYITTIIRDAGFRLWGNRVANGDFVTRTRTVDLVMDSLQVSHKWAIDLGLTKTYAQEVLKGLNFFMIDLKKAGAVIDFEVFLDPDLNTESNLSQGRAYWDIRFTDAPPAENPNFRVEVTNQWLTEIVSTN